MKRARWMVLVVVLLLCAAVASAGENWGALAYSSSTGRYGYGYDYATKQEAVDAAEDRCGEDDCEAVVWFYNGCGAFAAGRGGTGWAVGDSKQAVQAKALRECNKRGSNCQIVGWACTSR